MVGVASEVADEVVGHCVAVVSHEGGPDGAVVVGDELVVPPGFVDGVGDVGAVGGFLDFASDAFAVDEPGFVGGEQPVGVLFGEGLDPAQCPDGFVVDGVGGCGAAFPVFEPDEPVFEV